MSSGYGGGISGIPRYPVSSSYHLESVKAGVRYGGSREGRGVVMKKIYIKKTPPFLLSSHIWGLTGPLGDRLHPNRGTATDEADCK